MTWLASNHPAIWLPFLVAASCTGFSIPLAHALGILDQPGHIKIHTRATPRFGGLGIVAGVLVTVLVLRLMPAFAAAGLAVIALTGALDDKLSITPTQKLIGELAAGLLLGAAFAHGPWGLVGVAASVVLVVALANAVNLIDGMNGLAAGYTTVAAAGLAFLALSIGVSPAFACALSVASLGFLLWNFPKAKTFMGDVGSLAIGYGFAYLLMSLGDRSWRGLVSALPMVAVPLCDMTLGIVRRRLRGRPIFEGDRDHFYDVLHRKLGNPVTVIWVVYALSLAFVVLGLLMTTLPLAAVLVTYGASLLALTLVSFRLGFLPRRRETGVQPVAPVPGGREAGVPLQRD